MSLAIKFNSSDSPYTVDISGGSSLVSTVHLTATGATGSVYSWTLVPPTGSSAALTSTSSATPSFDTDVEGTYLVTLSMTDSGQTAMGAAALPFFFSSQNVGGAPDQIATPQRAVGVGETREYDPTNGWSGAIHALGASFDRLLGKGRKYVLCYTSNAVSISGSEKVWAVAGLWHCPTGAYVPLITPASSNASHVSTGNTSPCVWNDFNSGIVAGKYYLMVVSGFVQLGSVYSGGPVYTADTLGAFTLTEPSPPLAYTKQIGYIVGSSMSDSLMYFDTALSSNAFIPQSGGGGAGPQANCFFNGSGAHFQNNNVTGVSHDSTGQYTVTLGAAVSPNYFVPAFFDMSTGGWTCDFAGVDGSAMSTVTIHIYKAGVLTDIEGGGIFQFVMF